MKKYKPETFGVMLDLSRNAVMSIPSFKKYLGYLKKMGYNAVYFYNEDAYVCAVLEKNNFRLSKHTPTTIFEILLITFVEIFIKCLFNFRDKIC